MAVLLAQFPWKDLPWGTIWAATVTLALFMSWALVMWLKGKFKPTEELDREKVALDKRLERDKDDLLEALKHAREGICKDVSDLRHDLEKFEQHLERYYASREMLNGLAARLDAKVSTLEARVESLVTVFAGVDERASRALTTADRNANELARHIAVMEERTRALPDITAKLREGKRGGGGSSSE